MTAAGIDHPRMLFAVDANVTMCIRLASRISASRGGSASSCFRSGEPVK